jgi:hypothetical protein
MAPRLEDPGTVGTITATASLTSGRLDYWDTHGHLPLAIQSTDLGEAPTAGLNQLT